MTGKVTLYAECHREARLCEVGNDDVDLLIRLYSAGRFLGMPMVKCVYKPTRCNTSYE